MTTPKKNPDPQTPLARPTIDVAAELRDVHGKVISRGEAYAPPSQQTVSFYPSDLVAADIILKHTASLILTEAGIVYEVDSGRECPCSGRLHYHFEKKKKHAA